jgi:hypothetical protein
MVENTHEMKPVSNWPDQHRTVALKSYIYAQMSNNTYGQAGDKYDSDGNDFVLPPKYTVEHFGNSDFGFAYSIYKNVEENRLLEVIIAFRGTEGLADFDDVYFGNIRGKQNPLAIELYKEVRSGLDESGDANVPIVLTGHSLGGGLAIHTAINVAGEIPYYVFNSSPRFRRLGDTEGGDNVSTLVDIRHSLVETSEFLYAFRFPATEASQTYTPFNCENYFAPFTSHSIEKLAACLTMVAALNDPSAKVEMTKKN